eukprot:6490784-Amphidinium_carterae.2
MLFLEACGKKSEPTKPLLLAKRVFAARQNRKKRACLASLTGTQTIGVVKAVQALQQGKHTPNGRHRDLELRVLQALLPGQRISWMKAHLKQTDVDSGRATVDDYQGNQQADLLANQGTEQHGPLEPDPVSLSWQDFAMKVYHIWRLVGPQLRDRPKEQPRVKLPTEPSAPPPAAPARVPDTDAPFQLGQHQRAVKHGRFLQCLDCNRQAGRMN